MLRDLARLDQLDRYSALGAPILRIFIAFVLIYGTQDNVFDWERMIEFRDFLARNGFPYPLLSAHVSAYSQFICGIMLALGFYTRLAALVMCVNFLVALVMVHVGLPFDANIAPLAMFFGSVFFLLHGAGSFSLDARAAARRAAAEREPAAAGR